MKKKKSESKKLDTDELPRPKYPITKPITQDRAVEICRKLANSFGEDERVNLLIELVAGLCVTREGMKEAQFSETEIVNYHDQVGTVCTSELYSHSRQGTNSASQYLFDAGLAWEWKDGKVVAR